MQLHLEGTHQNTKSHQAAAKATQVGSVYAVAEQYTNIPLIEFNLLFISRSKRGTYGLWARSPKEQQPPHHICHPSEWPMTIWARISFLQSHIIYTNIRVCCAAKLGGWTLRFVKLVSVMCPLWTLRGEICEVVKSARWLQKLCAIIVESRVRRCV